MLVREWEAAEQNAWVPASQIDNIEDRAEKYLINQYKLCYISGKCRNFVPVLVPRDIIPAMNILIEYREEYGIMNDNKYVFATKTVAGRIPSHCSGWHALSELCTLAGVDIPITATKMRHRLSTIYASLNMSAADRKVFLDHMGHAETINQDNYQCPAGVGAIKVMGKILKNAEQRSSGNLKFVEFDLSFPWQIWGP